MKYIGSAHSTIKDLQLRLDANVLRNLKNETKMNEATQAKKEESEKVEKLMRELEEAKIDMAQMRRRVEATKTCLEDEEVNAIEANETSISMKLRETHSVMENCACNLDNGEGEEDIKYDVDPTKYMSKTPTNETN